MESSKLNKVLLVLKALVVAAALGVVVISCQNETILIDEDSSVQEQHTIDFASGFVDSRVLTKAAPVNLEQYNTTMGVWAWRSDSEISNELTFSNQLVEFEGTKWTYTPPKYWVMGSNYRFYAYSPQSDSQASINATTGMISIDGIVADSTDWMVARGGYVVNKTGLGKTVELTMQHILFNNVVRARVSAAVAADPGVQCVYIDTLAIGSFAGGADFSQKLNHTPGLVEDAAVASTEWTVDQTAQRQTLTYNGADYLGTQYTTLINALSIPQYIDNDMDLYLNYTMVYTDGRVERYVYADKLVNVFQNLSGQYFASGNTYTISILIGPETITFDAGSSAWTEMGVSDNTIE